MKSEQGSPALPSTVRKQTNERSLLERATKTPLQAGNLYHRNFKSELQPNRISSRFQNNNFNVQSSTRYLPATSQRQLVRSTTERTDARTTRNENILVSRLTSQFANKGVFNKDAVRKKEPDKLPKTQISNVYNSSAVRVPPTPLRAQSEPNIKYQVIVNNKTYKILRKIGSGGSAKVYEGFEPQTAQSVAIKIIIVSKADQQTQESFFNEKYLLAKLRDNKHVVRMYDSEFKKDLKELVIVMEKGDADLSQVIESYIRNRDCMIDGIFIKFYWRGMVQAVNSIHQLGIVHADLKPVNFILVKNEVKLIDFGIASAVDPEGTSVIRDYQIGTINYMAPEALRNRANDASFLNNGAEDQHKKTIIKYNSKADIWSLGCILYNLVYGKPPFDRYKDIVSKLQAITNPEHIIEFPLINNHNLLNCMKSCLRHNPSDRPTAQDLLNDPYLKEDVVTLYK